MVKIKYLTYLLLLSFFALLSCEKSEDSPSEPDTNSDSGSTLEVNLDKNLILGLVNEHRSKGATCGNSSKDPVSQLTWNDKLAQAALDHSNDMSDNDYFSHTGADGSSFSQRAKRTGYAGSPRAENIAWGQTSESAVIEAWMKSSGHCNNIMSGGSTEIGIARSDDGKYWTMVLGKGN